MKVDAIIIVGAILALTALSIAGTIDKGTVDGFAAGLLTYLLGCLVPPAMRYSRNKKKELQEPDR